MEIRRNARSLVKVVNKVHVAVYIRVFSFLLQRCRCSGLHWIEWFPAPCPQGDGSLMQKLLRSSTIGTFILRLATVDLAFGLFALTYICFFHHALISLNRAGGGVPGNDAGRILSLKLSKYTVNTLSRLLGHDWKDHTERMMGRRAHLNTRGCQSEQQGGGETDSLSI